LFLVASLMNNNPFNIDATFSMWESPIVVQQFVACLCDKTVCRTSKTPPKKHRVIGPLQTAPKLCGI
jgi:hypothetical protein